MSLEFGHIWTWDHNVYNAYNAYINPTVYTVFPAFVLCGFNFKKLWVNFKTEYEFIYECVFTVVYFWFFFGNPIGFLMTIFT